MSDWWIFLALFGVFFCGWEFRRGVLVGETSLRSFEVNRKKSPVLFHVAMAGHAAFFVGSIFLGYLALVE